MISIAIVAVPERRDLANALKKSLGDQAPVTIFYDVMRQGSWYNTRRAWLGAASNATHHIALEEDVITCKNFVKTAGTLAELFPDRVISFYSSKGDTQLVEKAKKNDCHWYIKDSVPSGQGVMMPVDMIFRFIAWADKHIDSRIATHEDENLWGFLQSEKIKSYFCVPNLIDHVGMMRSALGWNSAGKNSPYFIGADQDGTEIDWLKNIDKCPDYHQNYKNERCIRGFKGVIHYTDEGEEVRWL